MAKIAVYDRFYKNNYPVSDVVAEALQDSGHDVIARSWRMREAAAQILDFANDTVENRPDIVILGGMLEDDVAYKSNPWTVSSPCRVKRRTLFGRTKEVDGHRTTFLLPQFHCDMRTYHFPTSEAEVPRLPDEVAKQWESMRLGIAAAVLSRVVETYLPDTKRLGISSDIMFDAELHGAVRRGHIDAAQQLREQIGRFADGR